MALASSTFIGDGPNTVSEGTASNTKLSEFRCPHQVPGRELSELLSANHLCAKARSPRLSKNSLSLPKDSWQAPDAPSKRTILTSFQRSLAEPPQQAAAAPATHTRSDEE